MTTSPTYLDAFFGQAQAGSTFLSLKLDGSGGVLKGQVVGASSSLGLAKLATSGPVVGVAVADASANTDAIVQVGGLFLAGLGNGAVANAVVDETTFLLVRKATLDGGERRVGRVTAIGDVSLGDLDTQGTAPAYVVNPKGAPYGAKADGSDDAAAIQAALDVGSGQGNNLSVHVHHPRSDTAATATALHTTPVYVGNGANAMRFSGDRPGQGVGDGTWFSWKGAASPKSVIELRGVCNSDVENIGVDGGGTALTGLWLHSDQANSGSGVTNVKVSGLFVVGTTDSFPDGTLFETTPHSVAVRVGDVTGSDGFMTTRQVDTCFFERITALGSTNVSSVTHSVGTGPALTLSGFPWAARKFRAEVTTGATLVSGNMRFRWSDDNGSTWTSGVVGAATVLLGASGLTANFASGTYVNTDVYTWTTNTSYAGWKTMEAGNTSDHVLAYCNFVYFQFGIDWDQASGHLLVLSPTFGANYQACMRIGADVAAIIGPMSQCTATNGDAPFIVSAGSTGGLCSVMGGSILCNVSKSANHAIVQYGNVTAIANYFDGTDQAGSGTPAVVQVNDPIVPPRPWSFSGDNGQYTGIGNRYRNGIPDRAPARPLVVDGSNNDLTSAKSPYVANHKIAVYSFGESGGDAGGIFAIPPYVGTPISCSYVAPYLNYIDANPFKISLLAAGENRDGWVIWEVAYTDFPYVGLAVIDIYLDYTKLLSVIDRAFVVVDQPFLGGAVATCTMQIGYTGTPNAFLLASDIKGVSAGKVYGKADADLGAELARATAVQGCSTHSLETQDYTYLRVTVTGANLSALTQGKMRIAMHFSQVFDV